MNGEVVRLQRLHAQALARAEDAELRALRLRDRERELANKLLAEKLASENPLGRRNKKNDSFQSAFIVIRGLLCSGRTKFEGMTTSELCKELANDFRRLKPVTARGYLYKLKEQGFIEKRGAYWIWTQPAKKELESIA